MTHSQPSPLEGAHHFVIPKPGSRKLVIFFSGTDKTDGRFDWWRSGREQDAHQIFVNNGRNEWYQRGVRGLGNTIDDTIGSFRSWGAFLGATELYTVGVSMGGYGAALYGARLNAHILAFGYDSLLRTKGSRSQKRLPPRIATVVPDIAEEMRRSSGQMVHYAGEYDARDLFGAAHMLGIKNTSVRTLRGVGHGGAPFIEGVFGLTKFLERFLSRENLPTFDEEGTAALSSKIVKSYLAIHEATIIEDWPNTLRLSEVLIASAPHFEPARMAAGLALFKMGRVREAIEHLSISTALCPHFTQSRLRLAQCLLKHGDAVRALQHFRIYSQQVPKSAVAHMYLANSLVKLGRDAEAVEEIEIAFSMAPDEPRIAKRHFDLVEKNYKRQ